MMGIRPAGFIAAFAREFWLGRPLRADATAAVLIQRYLAGFCHAPANTRPARAASPASPG